MAFKRKPLRRFEGSQVGAMAQVVYVCVSCGTWQTDIRGNPVKPDFFCMAQPKCDCTQFHRFDSKTEARGYANIKLRERAGHIRDLKLQPKFPLHCPTPDGGRALVWTYYADFSYVDCSTDQLVIIDVKGDADTAISAQKRKHASLEYGVEIRIMQP